MNRPIGHLMPRLLGLPVQGWAGVANWIGSIFVGDQHVRGIMYGLAMGLLIWGAADGSAERRGAKSAETRDSHA